MQTGPREARQTGRHRADLPDGYWREIALMCVLVPIAFLVVAAGYAWRGTRAAAIWAWRQAVIQWKSHTTQQRLIAAMVACPFTAAIAAAAGLLPGDVLVQLVAGLAGVAFFWAWLKLDRWLGQRRWLREGGQVVKGAWRHSVAVNTDAIAALNERLAVLADTLELGHTELLALKEELAATKAALAGAYRMSGRSVPDGIAPVRHLYAVGEDTVPQPVVG